MAGRGNIPEVRAPVVRNQVVSGNQLNRVAMSSGLDPGSAFVQRALEHLRSLRGFADLPAEFAADPRVVRTSAGGATVHLRQQFKSIPVFLGAQAVRFHPDGQVDSSIGNAVAIDVDAPVDPRLTAAQAVLAAARHASQLGQSLLGETDDFGSALDAPGVNLDGFVPQVLAAFPEFPPQPTVLAPGPFGHAIKANLIWFPGTAGLTLGWEVMLTMPQSAGQYRVIVDANTGAILYSRQLVDMLTARASVYVTDGPPTARQTLSLPLPWSTYAAAIDPAALPPGVPPQPPDWLDDAARDTTGNCVQAHLGESGPPLAGRLDGGALVFEPSQADGDDQKVLNMFYFNSYLHDVFYMLGFREEDGNFQAKGVGGMPGDPVDARAHSGPVWGTANMLTPPDGTSPTMNMGLVAGTNRHTAFDASVVFHEYMHGVTNRLVGGPMNTHALETDQSKSMGEGWGDYIACTLTGRNIVGAWVTGKPEGIRSHPYDDQYPGTFGKIGTGIYTEMHRVGEIWCATLLAMNRTLNARLGEPRGQRLALQLVVDALKLSPANPSMLDMRDAILKALEQKRQASPPLPTADADAALAGIWAAFAKFGMGVGARSADASFNNLVEDFTPGVAATGQPTGTGTAGTSTGQPTGTSGDGAASGGTPNPSEAVRVLIPDGDPNGITRTLTASTAGPIRRAKVHIDIAHSYVADLEVKLVPPVGGPIMLYNHAYQDTPDLVADYTTDDKLKPLLGQPGQGAWRLIVADTASGADGALRGWKLELAGDVTSQPSGFDGGPATLDLAAMAAEVQRLNQALVTLTAKVDHLSAPH
jgi:extracellular elastinolytic metalloproteinase